MDTDEEIVNRRVLDAVADAVGGTEWAPPEGGLLAEAVVVLRWVEPDGAAGMNYVAATSHYWSTEGLLRAALRRHLDNEDHAEDAD